MNNAELKEYLSEKIDTNHKHTLQLLESIVTQTTKTNGRVSALEVKVWEVVKDESNHVANCPNVGRITALEEENLEIRTIKKYPKMALGVLVFFVAGLLFSVYVGYNKIGSELNTIQARQAQIMNDKNSLMKK